jgi:pimeloyl-ACP methyl ester carboxylesterase
MSNPGQFAPDHAPHGDPAFVFVHGGWSSGFNYHQVVTQLVMAGRRALALDLPGHGQSARFPASYLSQDLEAFKTEPPPSKDITLASCAGYVTDVVAKIADATGPVVLLGHSSGGIIIGKVASDVPQLIHRVVYMGAFMIVDRPSAVDYFDPRGIFPGVEELGVLRVNWRSPQARAQLKPALFPLSDDAVFTAFAHTWQPDFPFQMLTAPSQVDKDTWGQIPRTYIRFADDGNIQPAEQDKLIAAADTLTPQNKTDVHTVAGGHVDPFAAPAELAQILLRLS